MYFCGGCRNLNSQGRNSVYTILQSWNSSPLSANGGNLCSVLILSLVFPPLYSSTSKDQIQQLVKGNGATTMIWHLCRNLTQHLHASKYVPLNMPSGEDQPAVCSHTVLHFSSQLSIFLYSSRKQHAAMKPATELQGWEGRHLVEWKLQPVEQAIILSPAFKAKLMSVSYFMHIISLLRVLRD